MLTENQSPHFAPLNNEFLTEEELNKAVDVYAITVYGKYTCRTTSRKEVIEKDFEFEIEVPENYNLGHVKLMANRKVKKDLKGIRVRSFFVDEEVEPKKLSHKRMVKDFMSDRGLRDNERMKRNYYRKLEQRRLEMDKMAREGILPSQPMDTTQYDERGLMPESATKYVSV